MTQDQLIEATRKAFAEYDKLPDEEQLRHLIEIGTINEKGEVLMGLEEAKALEREEQERQQREKNGAAPAP